MLLLRSAWKSSYPCPSFRDDDIHSNDSVWCSERLDKPPSFGDVSSERLPICLRQDSLFARPGRCSTGLILRESYGYFSSGFERFAIQRHGADFDTIAHNRAGRSTMVASQRLDRSCRKKLSVLDPLRLLLPISHGPLALTTNDVSAVAQ